MVSDMTDVVRAIVTVQKLDSVEEIQKNSYKDFHAKGLDYLCLHREPSYTVKLYIFDGDVAKAPEVVNPHDHRYNFRTTCLYGKVANSLYREEERGEIWQRFQYNTPLNGGNGFTWESEARLHETSRDFYLPGDIWTSWQAQIHTLRIQQSQTVLLLEQFLSTKAVTHTWTKDKEPPSLDGLYSKFTHDEVLDHLRLLGLYGFNPDALVRNTQLPNCS